MKAPTELPSLSRAILSTLAKPSDGNSLRRMYGSRLTYDASNIQKRVLVRVKGALQLLSNRSK